jgi:23S rRNA (uracil1939-C5)-methyltransferase
MSERLLLIERLGHRGEGIARSEEGVVFVPYALPDEAVRAEVAGNHARLIEVVERSRDRIAPYCPHYGVCGGCPVQTLAPDVYAEWKRGLVKAALRRAKIDCDIAPLIDAHGVGRRRVTFHSRVVKGAAQVGFMRARSHEIVEIDACPLLAPSLSGVLPAARAVAQALSKLGKSLDIVINGVMSGLDVDIRGAGQLPQPMLGALVGLAEQYDLARLSLHGCLVALRRSPVILVGDVIVTPPPGAFLQATEEGERAIARLVEQAVNGTKRIADLFCGVGTFALRLGANASVSAFDSDAAAIGALTKAARSSAALSPLRAQQRDLFRRPLAGEELAEFDSVIFDPPRAGAEAQARAIAASQARRVVAVSCNPVSFAQDAKILLDAGYRLETVTPIDQFRYSAHVEIVAVFERTQPKRQSRKLLSF